MSAIHDACVKGDLHAVSQMIEADPALANAAGPEDMTPLHCAVLEGKTGVVKYLLDHTAYVDARDTRGYTPLHFAAREGKSDVAKYLLDRGADVEGRNTLGYRPLHLAASRGQALIVSELLRRGAAANARLPNGCTPLDLAVQKQHEAVIRLLHSCGAECTGKKNISHRSSEATKHLWQNIIFYSVLAVLIWRHLDEVSGFVASFLTAPIGVK